jgi:hypothetical protein
MEADGTYRFEVTISSPYDSPERYADEGGFSPPMAPNSGYATCFTTTLTSSRSPELSQELRLDEIEVVTIEGRDLVNGWGGATVEVNLP